MKAVNLIPADSRRGGRGLGGISQGPGALVIAALALLLAFVTVFVLTDNTIASRRAKLTALHSELAQYQAAAAKLSSYAQFTESAQKRVETVREIASARFNWHGALGDLAKVVPANVSLASLTGSVAPGASTSGTTGGTASGLRSDLTVPALVLAGCARTQDDVAGLISRLRSMNGVTRVTLGDSAKGGGAQGGTAGSGSTGGCGANAPSFDLVVFYSVLPNAGPTGVTGVTGPAGAVGVTGPAGAVAVTGPAGAAGAAGTSSQPVSTGSAAGAPR